MDLIIVCTRKIIHKHAVDFVAAFVIAIAIALNVAAVNAVAVAVKHAQLFKIFIIFINFFINAVLLL